MENDAEKVATVIIQQHVFWFEISVDDSFLVEVLQALDDLTDVETGPGFAETRVVLVHQVDVIPRWDAVAIDYEVGLNSVNDNKWLENS